RGRRTGLRGVRGTGLRGVRRTGLPPGTMGPPHSWPRACRPTSSCSIAIRAFAGPGTATDDAVRARARFVCARRPWHDWGMDALLLIDTDDASYPNDDAIETLGEIVTPTGPVGGVLIFATTKEGLAEPPDEELSVFVPDEEDLVLRSDNPDIFEGINDLAPGLHDMAVDRIVITGADDALGAVYASAMAALV